MKPIIFLLFMSLSVSPLMAQNSVPDFKYAIKLYNLASSGYNDIGIYSMSSTSGHYLNEAKVFTLIQPTFAILKKSNHSNFHEIELTTVQKTLAQHSVEFYDNENHNISFYINGDLKTTVLALRYEYILVLNKKTDAKFVASTGFGAGFRFARYKFLPRSSEYYEMKNTNSNLFFLFTPRLVYNLSDRWFFDLNLPLNVLDFELYSRYHENPSVEMSKRSTSNLTIEFFPFKLNARLGVGFRI